MIVARDHDRNVSGVEGWELNDHRFRPQIQHGRDIEPIVIRPRDVGEGVVLQLRVCEHGVPAAAGVCELVVHVEHRDVLVGALHEVAQFVFGQLDGLCEGARFEGCECHPNRRRVYSVGLHVVVLYCARTKKPHIHRPNCAAEGAKKNDATQSLTPENWASPD